MPIPQDYTNLFQSLSNERNCPELLPFRKTSVDHALAWIRTTQTTIDTQIIDPIQKPFYEIELERTKYLLGMYLETRLEKIERLGRHLNKSPNLGELLSNAEQTHLDEYIAMVDDYFVSTTLSKLPEPLQGLDEAGSEIVDPSFEVAPDMEGHVFCRAEHPLGNVETDPRLGTTLNVGRGDIYRVRYSCIRQAVHDGRVSLI